MPEDRTHSAAAQVGGYAATDIRQGQRERASRIRRRQIEEGLSAKRERDREQADEPLRTDPIPRELWRDEYHDLIGERAMRVLTRLCVASGRRRRVISSPAWLAHEFGRRSDGTSAPRRDPSGIYHAFRRLTVDLGILARTGRTEYREVRGRRVQVWEYRFEGELFDRLHGGAGDSESLPDVPTSDCESLRPVTVSHSRGSTSDCESVLEVTQSQHRGEEEEEEEEETSSSARTSAADLVGSAAPSPEEEEQAPPSILQQALGDLVRDSAPTVDALRSRPEEELALDPLPLPTEEQALAELVAPLPLDLAREWYAWWYPTDVYGLTETWAMQRGRRPLCELRELWQRYPHAQDWRAAMTAANRTKVRVVGGMEWLLGQQGAERTQRDAARAANERRYMPTDGSACSGWYTCHQRATWASQDGERMCERHAQDWVARGVGTREQLLHVAADGSLVPQGQPRRTLHDVRRELRRARSAAPTTAEPRETPIVQQRARERPPRASGAVRETA